MIMRVMRRMIGQCALDAKRIDHLERTIVESANVASGEWIIIAHGNMSLCDGIIKLCKDLCNSNINAVFLNTNHNCNMY